MARSMSDQLASARARRAARPSPMRRANPMGATRAARNTGACTNPEGACCSSCAKSTSARAGNPRASSNPYALVPPRFGGYWGGGFGGYNGWNSGWGWPTAYAYRRPVFVATPRLVRPHPSRVLAASVAPYYYGYNGWGGFASPVVF